MNSISATRMVQGCARQTPPSIAYSKAWCRVGFLGGLFPSAFREKAMMTHCGFSIGGNQLSPDMEVIGFISLLLKARLWLDCLT